MAQIAQVPAKVWRDKLAALSSQQDRDNLLRQLKDIQDTYATQKQALSAQYKALGGDWTKNPDFVAARTALQTKLESDMIALGYYETISDDVIEPRERDSIFEAIIRHRPASILSMVTRIANHFRSLQGKAALTEDQVKTRLLA